jgi:hypothetical protein
MRPSSEFNPSSEFIQKNENPKKDIYATKSRKQDKLVNFGKGRYLNLQTAGLNLL